MLAVRASVDVERVELCAHILETLAGVARLLCVSVGVGRGQGNVRVWWVKDATRGYGRAGGTARTRLCVSLSYEQEHVSGW